MVTLETLEANLLKADTEILALKEQVSAVMASAQLLVSVVNTHQQLLDQYRSILVDATTRDPGNMGITSPAEMAIIDPSREVETLHGIVQLQDIPMGPEGYPTEDWAMENCTCPVHEARRQARDSGNGSSNTGQYL